MHTSASQYCNACSQERKAAAMLYFYGTTEPPMLIASPDGRYTHTHRIGVTEDNCPLCAVAKKG
jgi:hypothetical protein